MVIVFSGVVSVVALSTVGVDCILFGVEDLLLLNLIQLKKLKIG